MYCKTEDDIISITTMRIGKISLVVTTFNEDQSIEKLIESVISQSIIPDELIIIDGQSKDNTVKAIKKLQSAYKKKLAIKIFIKKGNRSVGRNEGVGKSNGEIILFTDAGCILDKNWVKNIIKPFKDRNVDLVAGYYKGLANSIFQKCLIPYVLVMEDKINGEFLPATRSMAIRRSSWNKTDGFNESLSHNEDYAFAKQAKDKGLKMAFAKDAVVNWIPRNSLKSSFVMFFRFALGDIQANIIREKVAFIFIRYFLMLYLLAVVIIMKSIAFNILFISLVLLYLVWSIFKNYRYVKNYQGFFYLPLLQLTSDFAVMSGSSLGFIQKIKLKNILKLITNNKWIIFILLIYSTLMILLINWGIPNKDHPFNYAMDEWHFSQAIRAFIKFGTGSVSGAANIPLYHIVSSIFFLVPFYLFKIVNPLMIKGSLDNIPMQHTLFEILRLHTFFYGILSIVVIYSLLKNLIKPYFLLLTSFFVFSPIWISLTNYYKYDITLSFWIISVLYLLVKYFKTQKLSYYIFAGIALGLALSTKFTAAPLFIAYFFGYFILSDKIKYKELGAGILLSISVFFFLGIPDFIFGTGNYNELLYSTLIQSPGINSNLNLGSPSWFFILFKEFPSIFGYFLTYLFYFSMLFWGYYLLIKMNKINQYRLELFTFVASVLFLFSIIPFGIDGGGNRALVLAPFMILISAFFVKKLLNFNIKYKKTMLIFLSLGMLFQVIQSASWISVKFYSDPRETSSAWILKNIPVNSSIGIESIPIYQMLPNFVLKEFYSKKNDNSFITKYNYSLVSSLDNNFPEYVIVSNDLDSLSFVEKSPKENLVRKLQEQKYKKVKDFSPNLKYYNIFADYRLFVLANIMPIPVNIAIYEK